MKTLLYFILGMMLMALISDNFKQEQKQLKEIEEQEEYKKDLA